MYNIAMEIRTHKERRNGYDLVLVRRGRFVVMVSDRVNGYDIKGDSYE